MRPRIGLDLDGPIVNLYPHLHQLLVDRFDTHIPPWEQWRSYTLRQLGIPQPELQGFLSKIFRTWPPYERAEIVEGAAETLRWLRLSGFHLEIVTSRPQSLRRSTRKWLASRGLLVHHVIHAPRGAKQEIVADRQHVAFLEDNPWEAASLVSVTRSFLFHRSYNSSFPLKGSTRVRTWEEFRSAVAQASIKFDPP